MFDDFVSHKSKLESYGLYGLIFHNSEERGHVY